MEVTAEPIPLGRDQDLCWGLTYRAPGWSATVWVKASLLPNPRVGQSIDVWDAENGAIRGVAVDGETVFLTSQSEINRGLAQVERQRVALGRRAKAALSQLDISELETTDPPGITGRLVGFRHAEPRRHAAIDLTDSQGRRRVVPIYIHSARQCQYNPEFVPGAPVSIWLDGGVDDGNMAPPPERGLRIGDELVFYKSQEQLDADRNAVPDTFSIYQPNPGPAKQPGIAF